jgi:uncharacterized protein (DUF924 family)
LMTAGKISVAFAVRGRTAAEDFTWNLRNQTYPEKLMRYDEILHFWFEKTSPAPWFKKDDEFDRMIKERFANVHPAAVRCERFKWRVDPLGRLAEIIVLDQCSRNMYRNQPAAFAFDPLALAQEAIRAGVDNAFSNPRKLFLYMPFMHSESAVLHEIAVVLFSTPGMEKNLEYEQKHKAIIDRFGRYPHRNEILGRESTAEELEFLDGPGSSF